MPMNMIKTAQPSQGGFLRGRAKLARKSCADPGLSAL